MELVTTIAGWVAALVGVPLALLMAVGFYANSEAAERRAWRAIERACEAQGCTEVEAFTNSRASYGVRYTKGGRRYRGKCGVSLLGAVHWDKNDPAEV